MSAPRSLLADRYRLGAALGAGGMGAVYLAVDTRLERQVAVKLLPASSLGDRAARERLLREALAGAALRHPGIAHVYDVGKTDDGGAYLVMELVGGASLRDLIAARDWDDRARIAAVIAAARALGAAHRAGLIHRDVKPDNLMRREDGTVVLLDFGIAKASGEHDASTAITGEGIVVGTPAYLSPEQARGLPLDARTDQFSLAVTAHELLARALPWRSTSAVAVVSAILTEAPPPLALGDTALARAVQPVLERAMAKGPSDRYPDVDAFADALATAAGLPVSSSSPIATPAGRPVAITPEALARTELAPGPTGPSKQKRWRAAMVSAVVVGSLAAGIASWRARRNPLDVPVPVVACPVLEGTDDGEPAAWLGAAGAYALCDELAPMLGGFHHHVRYPAALLGKPGAAMREAEDDPWLEPDVRARSIASAKSQAGAWIDGEVRATGPDFTIVAIARDPNGRELGRATATDTDLHRAALEASRRLRGAGALGNPHPLDEDYRRFHEVTSAAQVDAVREWKLALRREGLESCEAPPGKPLPPGWEKARASGCEGKLDAAGPLGAISPFAYQGATDESPAWASRVRQAVSAFSRGEAQAELLLTSLDDFAGIRVVTDEDPRVMWTTLGDPIGPEWEISVDLATWAPDDPGGWVRAGHLSMGKDPSRATALLLRGVRIAPESRANLLAVAAQDMARAGQVRATELVAARLSRFSQSLPRDIGRIITDQAQLGRGAFKRTFDDWRRDLDVSVLCSKNRHDNLRLSLVRELAFAIGRERELGNAVATAFGEGRTTVAPVRGNIFAVQTVAVTCALAEPERAKACLSRLVPLAKQYQGEETLLIAAKYVDGDLRGAAESARAVMAEPWFRARFSDFLVDVFDRGGMPELAEELDRPRADDRELHGVSLATLTTARRAWKRGDKVRARELAKRIVEAWRLVDATVPGVAEMEAILHAP